MSNDINLRIATHRSLAGYTQTAAAQELGIKRSTYARMEKYGNPTPEMLKKIAVLFNVSVNKLLYGETEEEKNPVSLVTDADSLKNSESLRQEPFSFADKETYAPSHKEMQIIKMYHYMPKEKQKEVRDLIEALYKKDK